MKTPVNTASEQEKIQTVKPGESFNLFKQFSQTVRNLNKLRIQLGISDEELANHLGICMNTYRSHKRKNFIDFTVEQVMQCLGYFSQQERNDQQNNRIQRHHRNHSLIENDDMC